MSKSYGLIIPDKINNEKAPIANFSRPSVFGDDSDSDPEIRLKPIKGPGINQKLQAKKIQKKALEEDPTIFQYDELYDEMAEKRKEVRKAKSNEVKEAKYIAKLLETAEKRKKEQERRIERQVQKEREAEGEMFKDKEAFVTSAYRLKLEEMKKAEEEEKRAEYLESIGDVTKQKDLGGFYRHLYEQKLGGKSVEEDKPNDNENKEKPETKLKEKTKERIYRKRKTSQDERDEEEQREAVKKLHLHSNLDADSDFSIDDSSSDSETDEKIIDNNRIEVKEETKPDNFKLPEKHTHTAVPIDKVSIKEEDVDADDKSSNEKDKEKSKIEPLPKPKIDIWKKRTVGDIFDAAVERYYERKCLRNLA